MVVLVLQLWNFIFHIFELDGGGGVGGNTKICYARMMSFLLKGYLAMYMAVKWPI